MKIMVCGSMFFAKKMSAIKSKLEKLGYKVVLPCDIDKHLEDSTFSDNLEEDTKYCIEHDVIRKCFKTLAQSDAILILNYPKNGIEWYIGTAGLMEIGIAYHLGKKIFILNQVPSPSKARWAHEVHIMQPVILNNDLTKIK
jgi:nucleoside 2-deoxyribosyltransferase